jgi:hypothetical protein
MPNRSSSSNKKRKKRKETTTAAAAALHARVVRCTNVIDVSITYSKTF